MPKQIKRKGLWLWTSQGKTDAEKLIRDAGGGDQSVKSFDTWHSASEKITKAAIGKEILTKLLAKKKGGLGNEAEEVNAELQKTEVIFELFDKGVKIIVGGSDIAKKTLW